MKYLLQELQVQPGPDRMQSNPDAFVRAARAEVASTKTTSLFLFQTLKKFNPFLAMM
jgi:hypothetical protein